MTAAPRASRPASSALTLLVGAACSGLLAVACTADDHEPVPPPPSIRPITTAASVPDLAGVAVEAVGGRTTTTAVAFTPGDAVLSGVVTGPDGPVAGATVHIERLVGDAVGLQEVQTAPDGSWSLPAPLVAPAPPGGGPGSPPPPQAAAAPPTRPPVGPTGILGGRYRVRAWRSPDLALTTPQILFLGGNEKRQLPLALNRFSGVGVTSDIAPDPPLLGDPANLALLVANRSVDAGGVVRSIGVANAEVQLVAGAGWQVDRPQGVTDGGGRVVFALRCRALGVSPLSVVVAGQAYGVAVPACAAQPPSTTAPPETSVPPDPSPDTSPDGSTTSTSTASSTTSTTAASTTTTTTS